MAESQWKRDYKVWFTREGVELDAVRDGRRTDIWTAIRGQVNPGRSIELVSEPVAPEWMNSHRMTWPNTVWVMDAHQSDIKPMVGLRNGVLQAFSWDRCPPMVWKGCDDWNGGHQVYANVNIGGAEFMLRIQSPEVFGDRAVKFDAGYDGAARVWTQVETREAWLSRYLLDIKPIDVTPERSARFARD